MVKRRNDFKTFLMKISLFEIDLIKTSLLDVILIKTSLLKTFLSAPKSLLIYCLTLMCVISLGLSGCSSTMTRPSGPDVGTSTDIGGNTRDQRTSVSQAQRASEPEPLKVAVILGPGGYKSFAHAGVIKELKKKNVPINAVVGMEWGSLVGALFAQRGQMSEAEWKLYKLEKVDLDSRGFFSRKKDPKDISILDSYLKENLNVPDVQQMAVPFFCPSFSIAQGVMGWQDRGPLVKAVKNCLAYPPLFKHQASPHLVAGLFTLDDIVLRLKKEGYGVIILVNVLGDGVLFDEGSIKDDYSTTLLWNEVRRNLWKAKSLVSDIIEVNTRGIGFSDFESRKLLVTAGEAAGEKAAQALVDKYGF